MMHTALLGPAQQWYPHLPLEIKKEVQEFCREFQKTIDIQQTQTQAKLLLDSITRALGEQNNQNICSPHSTSGKKICANNAPDMKNAQINDALVKALEPQLA